MTARPKQRLVDEQLTMIEPEIDERAKVESWRLHVLIEAGYALPYAERIAQSHADLHEAVSLIRHSGCTPEVAAQILL